ncbi:hypothetical protein J7M23_00830 [Candidatus Sumerlaeota bacterium]|nr:hypothetical protein [Candidatus Sumerlaeota bacterium]
MKQRKLSIVILVFVIAVLSYAEQPYVQLCCNRLGAGDDSTHWAINFEPGQEPTIQLVPQSYLYKAPSYSQFP